MKNRILFLIATFVAFLPVFAIQKPLFMIYHYPLARSLELMDYLKVIVHGFSLDMTIAGYLTILPLLLVLLSVWLNGPYLKVLLKGYFLIVSIALSAIFSVDVALYSFWGFRLDATPLFYLQSPGDAMASIPAGLFVLQTILFLVYGFAICWLFWKWIVPLLKDKPVKKRLVGSLALLLAGGILFIPIRGGVSVATANVGQVYFSSSQFLNHSAINPCFSLVASLVKQQNYASQYNFLDEKIREDTFQSLTCVSDSSDFPKLLNNPRPNIILILMESFSSNAIEVLGGQPGITPNLNRLSRDGVLFDNFFANSFRTDRGIVSVLNGYPAQPTTSIMKYPIKSQTLPSIAKSLDSVGYKSDMLYGGDINFTNMQSYFYSSGYQQIVADRDFPLKDRLSKWGANDNITFNYLLERLKKKDAAQPFFTTFLTLSSHEPFEVPFHHLENPYLNSVAFTDSCIGSFIDGLKALPVWENTLVILLSDHGFRYPETIESFSIQRHKIPMIWSGGAIRQPATIRTYASQIDLAATLLGQMDIDHSAFAFSKNILNAQTSKFAFYTFNNGFGFIDSTGASVYDCESNRPLVITSQEGHEQRLLKGKAMLQTLYDDLGSR